jgi:polyisoprenoid-binding protein YceI
LRKQLSTPAQLQETQMTTEQQTQQALPTGTWHADPVHSAVGFGVDYIAGAFQGAFAKFEASVSDGRLHGAAEVASVQVKDENLEAHLQSPDFFDAERNPQLSFESRDITREGDEVTIQGEITLKGHTEPVEIHGRITDPADDPYGNVRFGLQLETSVDRTQFGIDWNNPLPSGEAALSNEVRILANLQLVREA